MGAPFRLALAESLLVAIIGMRQMIGTGEQRAEPFAVRNHATHRDAAEPDTVVAALAADHALARGFTAGAMIGKRHFERGIGSFGSGIAKERIIEITRRQIRQARGKLENLRVAELKRRSEVKLGCLFLYRFDDRSTAMTGVGTPQTGGGIKHRAPGHFIIMHVLGPSDETRPLLESPVGGERHKEGFEIVRRGFP